MAKQNKPRGKRDKCVKMYVTAEELSVLLESSGRAGLSLSTFARRVCLAIVRTYSQRSAGTPRP